MNWDSVRDSFMIPEGYTYLNNGTAGPCPRAVFEKTMEWQRLQEVLPACNYSAKVHEAIQESKALFADFAGMRLENFFFTLNLTVGMNIIANGISSLKPGDEVILSNQEYPSVNSAWEYYMKKNGVIIKRAEIPIPLENPDQIIEAYKKVITPCTKVMAFPHISCTAIIFPVHSLCRLAKEHGIMTVIDGAHAPGMIPLKIEDIGCDFYTGNCHKWLCAPMGTAFVYVAPHMQNQINPLIVIASSGKFPDNFEYIGTCNTAQKTGIGEAVKFFNKIGFDKIVEHGRELTQYARKLMMQIPGVQPMVSAHPDFQCSISKYIMPPMDDPKQLSELLNKNRIIIPAGKEKDFMAMRISTHLYNTAKDVDLLIRVVREAYRI